MKRKRIEKIAPTPTKKKGLIATVQELEEILILNIYIDKMLLSRYCLNTKTGEYETYMAENREWNCRKLISACGFDPLYDWIGQVQKKLAFNSLEEKQLAWEKTKENGGWNTEVVHRIDYIEDVFNRDKREKRENNRMERVNRMMNAIPEIPDDIEDWIWEKNGAKDYAFFDKALKGWNTTCCNAFLPEKMLKRPDGSRARHNDMVECCICKKMIQAKRRQREVHENEHFSIIQPVCDKYSVARHFNASLGWTGKVRYVNYEEQVRIVLFKLSGKPKDACDIYYKQRDGEFDNRGNACNRRSYAGYLYGEQIEEALDDTDYSEWGRVFAQMSAVGAKAHWNRLMCARGDKEFVRMVEYLFKGRFYKLLIETSEDVSYWGCEYAGELNKQGENIEEVFNIKDRQKINRIRDLNGGKETVSWMRWSDQKGVKIPQETLDWLLEYDVSQNDLWFILDYMKPQQIKNYILRQQKGSYAGKTVLTIIDQWKDYMNMCRRLHKKLDDEMIHRPGNLKQRHDEAVALIAQHEAQVTADEYSRRFPGVEDVLRAVKEKLEYTGSEYVITVPQRCADIVAEGRCLHHCAGSSDRYFDRIKQQETYICFLRKVAEPDIPYYTIEVEPGGTIRQHRGMFDEEPDIEQIKPFLREWQKVIKERMREEDKKLAQISAVKREENLAELREKNNTRVLEGLMEDFMEAI